MVNIKNIRIFIILLISILSLIMSVDAKIPVTYTCCINYSLSNGTQLDNFENINLNYFQIDGFENLSNWILGGIGSNQTADTVNFKEGNQGLKLIATNGYSAYIDKVINNSFANTTYFGIWVYVPDNTNFYHFNVYFTSTGSTWSKYFMYPRYGLQPGWNNLVFDKSSFTNYNGENWNNTMNRIRLTVYPTGGNTSATLDDIRYSTNYAWIVGNGGIEQPDIINFKEGNQGLKLIATNGTTYIDRIINNNFSNTNNVVVWTYIENASNTSRIQLYLASNASFNTYFTDTSYGIKSGWNKLIFNKHNFISWGEDWNKPMVKIRLRLWPFGNNESDATFDDLRYDIFGQRAKLMIHFDDAESNIYTNAFPILQKNNQIATTFVITGWSGSAYPDSWNAMNVSQLKALQASGWDISSHTVDHDDLTNPAPDNLTSELNDSYSWLVSNNFQKTAGFIAYPYGRYNDSVINSVKKRYIFGRSTMSEASQPHFAPYDDSGLYVQRITSVYNDTTVQSITDKINDTINAKLVGIVLFHGVLDSNPTNDIYTYDTANFSKVSDYIKSRSSDVDVVTYSDYIIPNINAFTPVINKTTRIYSNGSSIIITKNKYDEYMPNMTITPLSDSIDVNISTYDETLGNVKFNESSQNASLQVTYDIGDRVPNQIYNVKIYWANGTKYQDFNILSDNNGHIKYNSTGFGSSRTQIISTPLSIINSYPLSNNTVSILGQLQQFQLSLNRNADIMWYIDGSNVQTNPNVLTAVYSNSTAGLGIHNVSVIINDGLDSPLIRTWNWSIVNDIYNIVHQKYLYQKQNVVINFSLSGYSGMVGSLMVTSPNGNVTTNKITMRSQTENESVIYSGVNELGVYNISYLTPNFTTSSIFEYKQKPIMTFVSASDLHYGYGDDPVSSGFTIRRFVSDINNKVLFPSPDFVALVGDTTDSVLNNYTADSKTIYDTLNVPYYISTGDHEEKTYNDSSFENPGYQGQTFYNSYGTRYNYTISKGDYTFIFGGVDADYTPLTNYAGVSFGDTNFSLWLDGILNRNSYKPTIAFSHKSAQQPRDAGRAQYYEGETYGSVTRGEFEKYGNTIAEFSGHNHLVGKNITNNITYIIDGTIINEPYVFDYVEIYPDKIQVHTIPYRLDTDAAQQYDGFYWEGETDSTHTIATYSTGNPDERDFTIPIVSITPTTLTNLWNFTANNISSSRLTLGNNNIYSNNILVNLSAYETRHIINMTATTSSDIMAMNITTFNSALVKFNESSPNSTIQVIYNIGDRIPNQTYDVKIYWSNGTQYQDLYVVANNAGYINYNSTGFGYPRYQEITPYQIQITGFTVSLPAGYTSLTFNASNSTMINLEPNGQNSIQPIFNITNIGNVNQSFTLSLDSVVNNITTYADLSNNYSVGKLEINTTDTTVIPSLSPNSSQNIWMIVNINKARAMNTSKVLKVISTINS